jgi:hypothetical protein
MATQRYRLLELLNIMARDTISTPEKCRQLSGELAAYFGNTQLLKCTSMGALVKQTLRHALRPYLSRIQKNLGKLTD